MVFDFINRIRRKLMKLRLQPIRVFCFHHVSEQYDASYMWECDWVNTDVLKQAILELKNHGYRFISLPEARTRLQRDWFRYHKYAVLTADDGFKTLLNIVPWLIEQQIPISLFVNSKYIMEDGMGENVQERLDAAKDKIVSEDIYLNRADVMALQSSLVTYAYHGYEHCDEWKMDEDTFVRNVEQGEDKMHHIFPNIIPFYAHTYGHTRRGYDEILKAHGLVPVYVSGNVNYNDAEHIDRELISNERIQNNQIHV